VLLNYSVAVRVALNLSIFCADAVNEPVVLGLYIVGTPHAITANRDPFISLVNGMSSITSSSG
jgi:hypothetical protein